MADRRIPYREVQGFKMPITFSSQRFLDAIAYTAQRNDIFLGSYPKTGSTWLQYIVYLVINNGRYPDDVASLLATTPYVQRDGFDMVGPAEHKERIALKYQMPFSYVPYSSDAKYIYIARNPKDTCVSFYHFCRMVPEYEFEAGTFDEFFEIFMSGDIPFGDYIDNLTSWYEHLEEQNFLFVTYEDMKANTKDVIVKIANFLGHQLEEEVIKKIAHYSSFQYMKTHVNSYLERYLSTCPATFKLGDLDKRDPEIRSRPALIRKGEVGQCKFYFNREQNYRMNRIFLHETAFTNAKNLWPDIMVNEGDDV